LPKARNREAVDSDSARTYRSWSALAGYFDGDGTVEFGIKKFVVEIRLAFDDNWEPFLQGIRRYLVSQGITPGAVRRKEQSMTWHLLVAEIASVRLLAKKMVPYSVKKNTELRAVLAYLGDKMTGNEFVQTMNSEVMLRRRTGKLHGKGPLLRRSEGIMEAHRNAVAKAAFFNRIRMPRQVVIRLRRDRLESRLTYRELTAIYGHSEKTLRRLVDESETQMNSNGEAEYAEMIEDKKILQPA
jgi:intein/homing endonuclease